MDNAQHIPVTETLLARYLAGEASPEEAMIVDDWLEAHPENQATFDQLACIWDHSGGEPYCKPDVAGEWRHFAGSYKKKSRAFTWLAAAAALLCLIAASRFLLSDKQGKTVQLAATNGIRRDTFPDGSLLVTPPGSTAFYKKDFGKREVTLKGEGYFDVQHKANRPFVVAVEELQVRVIGTAFNIQTSEAYITVAVNRGVVQVISSKDTITVSEGQYCRYHRPEKTFEKTVLLPENKNAFAYATRSLHFQQMKLSEAIRVISKTYNTDIRLEHDQIGNCSISATFENKPLPYILDVIASSLDLRYRTEGNIIYIAGDGCN